jgi:aspartyl-tRNA(Asn)/glutamyl-tRNA(Gln) amidotransferase subunit A
MSELAFMTAKELGALYRSRQVSPVEVTESILQRIDQYDGGLRTYITPLHEAARQQAQDAERKIMQGEDLGPLHGIPIGIKDNKYTRGIRTTDGSLLFAEFYPSESATVVENLERAGMVMLGKQNMHVLASGSTGTNPYYGTTRNPWNTAFMPGGSSGGGTAALAAGLSALSTGSDTFGSIRLPAAMCGVYGLNPTYGLVSTHGMFPSAWSLDTAGPMARSVWELAIMLEVMAGYDPKDPASLNVPVPDYTEGLEQAELTGYTVGIPAYYLKGLDEDVADLFQQAVRTLEMLGVSAKEMEIPELEMAAFAGMATVGGEAAAFHHRWLKTHPEYYPADVRSFYLAGSLLEADAYVKAQQARRRLAQAMDRAFSEVDFLLGPTIPMVTPPYEEDWVTQNLQVLERTMPFTVPVNLTGVPALSVPMGLDTRGMPIGMQLIGNHLSEKQLLRAGSAWEKVNPLQLKADF